MMHVQKKPAQYTLEEELATRQFYAIVYLLNARVDGWPALVTNILRGQE